MKKNQTGSALDQASSQELQHLITVSTGFVDAYIIDCHAREPMLLPQNIVLSALDSATHVKTVDWHDVKLPVFNVNAPDQTLGVALVIEGEQADQRFALMCNEMPRSIRLRISEVVDDQRKIKDKSIKQYVSINDERYHVPDIEFIQKKIGALKN